MNRHLLGYREVIPDQTVPEKWQEIKLNTGGTQSTLQDIKMTERAGGYCFKDSTKSYTRNRFIYWRSNHDVLELVDMSLDLNLSGNQIRLKFTNSPLLDGITLYEANGYVMLLVATVSSLHRITFPHPDSVHRNDKLLSNSDVTLPSIFHDGNHSHNCHVLTNTGAPLPNAAATWLSPNADFGVFSLAFNSGNITCITMDYTSGNVSSLEVKEDSYVPKFFANLTGVLRGKTTDSHACSSLALVPLQGELFLFGACRDGEMRMWSTKRGTCVASCPLLADGFEGRQHLQGAQGHVIRSCIESGGMISLAVFLCLGHESQIAIFRPILDQSGYRFIRVAVLFAQQQDLVDFALSETHIWALWSNSQGEPSLSSALLQNDSGVGLQWLPASLESGRERDCLGVEPGTDPRQLYCSYIFHPGQFQLSVIARALSIYSRQPALSELNMSISILKEKVCQAVEMEIHSEVEMCEINDDVYLEIAGRCWSRFYSCCLQYHLSGARPLGLVALNSAQGAALVRRALISLIRPVDPIEHLVLCGDSGATVQHLSHITELANEPGLQNLIVLVSGLVMLERQLPEDAKCQVEKGLYELRQPTHIISELVSKMKDGENAIFSTTFLDGLWNLLESMDNIFEAMRILLGILDIGTQYDAEVTTNPQAQARSAIAISHLFCSLFGMSMIAESLRQIASVRFSICRNLLILSQLMKEAEYGNGKLLLDIQLDMHKYLQAYSIILWLCETPTSPSLPTNMLESSILRFSSLHLKSSIPSTVCASRRTLTLLELFLQGAGAANVLSELVRVMSPADNVATWHMSMLPFIAILSRLVWSVSGSFTFGEWLIGSGQHLLLQEYVRLLRNWCACNRCSRQFILAVSLLETGEPHKALDLFLQASHGVSIEAFLINKILSGHSESLVQDRVIYCMKVIKLFEEHGASDCIITLAKTAIGIADEGDPNVAMFQSIMFKKHLLLEHFQDAYTCLSNNTDNNMRKDCLRELVGVLFSKKKLDLLLSFPYVEFYEDFQKIVEGRAKASDIMSTQYYNFLYAFYVNSGNLRKAAVTMYDQACRLSSECPTSVSALQKQSQCLLATLNALHLVAPCYAWLVKPQDRNNSDGGHSNKRDKDGDIIPVKPKVDAMDINDIENELAIVNARLKLAKYSSELQSIVGTDICELVGCLSSVGLYTTAIKLCLRLKLSLKVPFENLASACVRLTEHDDPEAWNWMIHNDLSDLGIHEKNISVVAWRLLQVLLERHEDKKSTELHMAVTKRLLNLGVFLPNWLMASYKFRNASELLRLMLLSGRIIEASDLCKELLWAALGRGHELFGMDTYLLSTSPPVCMPLSTVDHLLSELHHLKEDELYNKCYIELNKVVEYYIENMKKTSEDMIQMKKSVYCK